MRLYGRRTEGASAIAVRRPPECECLTVTAAIARSRVVQLTLDRDAGWQTERVVAVAHIGRRFALTSR